MSMFTKPLTAAMAGLFATSALVGAAQAAGSYTGDANGDVMIKPSAAAQAEVKADGDATMVEAPETVTGDANGEIKIQPGAAANAEAQAEAPVATPKDMVGDANGEVKILETDAKTMASTDMDLKGYDVLTVDGETVGEVAAVNRGPDGKILSIEAEVGGFLGLGSDTVIIPAERFDVSADAVQLNMSEAEVKVLTEN